MIPAVSWLRRLVLADRDPSAAAQDGERKSNRFFITGRVLPQRRMLDESEFECLARVIRERRQKHGFLLTAWAFLPDSREGGTRDLVPTQSAHDLAGDGTA